MKPTAANLVKALNAYLRDTEARYHYLGCVHIDHRARIIFVSLGN